MRRHFLPRGSLKLFKAKFVPRVRRFNMKDYKIMADSVMLNIGPNFDFNAFADRLAQMYAAQGFAVSVADINSAKVIKFEKETGGINTVLGLGVGITATCSIYNGVLQIMYTDAEWNSKIIGGLIGWFVCLVPLITAIIGAVRQSDLPKNIGRDAGMIVAQMG